ncbi:IclR family transcriptional regulator [Syntrophaceticus schinkii]|uniref:Transcriptional regulator, IclR family n=1 Tax=Syntrophaceticus schinkii TaxID=499207 RepID=A0A0B7MF07_9FIRM
MLNNGSAGSESLPAYCTATGKVLLAALPPEKLDDYIKKTRIKKSITSKSITEPDLLKQHLGDIKKQGYAVDNEEIEEGLVCIAVPLRNSSAQIIAAISISGMAVRMKRDLDGKIQLMKQFSKRISMQALGWNPS